MIALKSEKDDNFVQIINFVYYRIHKDGSFTGVHFDFLLKCLNGTVISRLFGFLIFVYTMLKNTVLEYNIITIIYRISIIVFLKIHFLNFIRLLKLEQEFVTYYILFPIQDNLICFEEEYIFEKKLNFKIEFLLLHFDKSEEFFGLIYRG